MNEICYHQLAQVEDRLWWHESRRSLIRLLLRRISFPEEAAALDVGCGTGGSLELLSEYATRVVGLDMSPEAIRLAQSKHEGAELYLGDANALAESFEKESFDLVTFFNVLYHAWITDELTVLRQAWNVLKPGGAILITDPAFDCLFRNHDRVAMGERRYTLSGMRDLLERAGFHWMAGSYFNMVSFPPAWLLAMWDRLHPGDKANEPLGELAVPPLPINEGMKFLMACERVLIRLFGRLPIGVTLVCLARKSDKIVIPQSESVCPALSVAASV